MNEIGLIGAFLGGVLALLSPCSALLLPSFFAYASDSTATLTRRTGLFLCGMLIMLVPLGAGVGALGSAVNRHRDTVTMFAALVVIILGLYIMSGRGFGSATAGRIAARTDLSAPISAVILGVVYGLAGFCSGPLLGAVLTVAVAGGSAIYGGILMAVYAFGMTIPLFVLAVLWDRYELSTRKWLRPRMISIGRLRTTTTSLISGALFVGIGVLFLVTDGTAALRSPVGSSTMAHWQAAIRRATDHLSDVWVLLVLAVGAAVILAIRIIAHYRRTER